MSFTVPQGKGALLQLRANGRMQKGASAERKGSLNGSAGQVEIHDRRAHRQLSHGTRQQCGSNAGPIPEYAIGSLLRIQY